MNQYPSNITSSELLCLIQLNLLNAEKPSNGALDSNSTTTRQPGGKLFRDWLKIVIPLVIAVATIWSSIWFGFQQSNEQNQHNRQLAQKQYRETTLRAYIDNIRNLLLHHNLAHSPPRAEVTQAARVQTLNTLRTLNANGNKIVFQFLHDAGLISAHKATISLSNADLSGANLAGAQPEQPRSDRCHSDRSTAERRRSKWRRAEQR